jgi:hypothetical protein
MTVKLWQTFVMGIAVYIIGNLIAGLVENWFGIKMG